MDESKDMKKGKKRRILIPVIIAAAVLVLIFAIIIPAMRSMAYKNALALKNGENYAEAQAEFEKLGTYMDSSWQADVCENYIAAEKIYAEALKQHKSGNWEAAEKEFDKIKKLETTYFNEDYKDTATLLKDCKNHQRYEEAIKLMNNEEAVSDIRKALLTFQDLGEFEDSKAKADKCQKMIKNSETYQQASECLDQEDYAGAEELFESLGDYRDSAEKTVDCRVMTDYEALLELYYAGEYKNALEAAEVLESTYENAGTVIGSYSEMKLDDLKQTAQAEEDLNKAEEVFNTNDYEGASKILEGIDSNNLTIESVDRRTKMENTIRLQGEYDQAMKYYNNSSFYEAYEAFLDCGDYKDSAEMAGKCAQPFPDTGVVYANEAYGDRSSELTIDNSGYMNAYYKLYLGEDLVMTVFIPENGIATFGLPAGNYKMTKCYGDTWYGTKDLFGDDGYYWICSFGSSETAMIEPGYAYEITSGGEGTGIGTSAADRNSV